MKHKISANKYFIPEYTRNNNCFVQQQNNNVKRQQFKNKEIQK